MHHSILRQAITRLFRRTARLRSIADQSPVAPVRYDSGSGERNRNNAVTGLPLRRASGMMPIEARMLFDGAIGATADAVTPEPDQIPPAVQAATDTQNPTTDSIVESVPGEPNLETSGVELASPDIVVFVDERLADREQLLADVPADTHVVVINANRSGVDQMAQALDGLAGVQSVHILSTGEPGRLNLGGSVLTAESIRGEYGEQLALLGASLSETADILIYGCNFGADTDAGSAAQAFADATGADVASSTDLTGHASRGGDWVLEREIGEIRTIAMDPTDWTGLLDPVIVSTTTPPVVTPAAGTNTAAPYNINGITQGGVLVQPGTSSIIGTTALWTAAGSVGGQTIDLRATVINAGANDMIQFSSAQTPTATTDDPIVVVGEFGGNSGGPAQDVQVQVRWEVLQTGTNTQLSGDLSILFTDIDGVAGPGTREAIAASVFDPVSYTLENPTDLVGSVQGNLLQVDGTVPNTGGNESLNNRVWTRFNWINESDFEITYILYANNGVTFLAGFSHDGDGDLQFTNPVTASIPKLDLDQTAPGNDSTTTFTEDAGSVAVIDANVDISNSGGTITGATITLTNRQTGDDLTIGALPGALSATTDTSNPGLIIISITGTGTDAEYETALQTIAYNNTSQAPDTTQRIVEVQVQNALTAGNTARTLVNVVAVNDAPVNAVPGAQALTEDTAHSFSTATSNAITVSDIDVGSGNLSTTLSVPAGALNLGSTAGVTVSGNGTGTVTVTGTAAAINAAMNGLTYTPVPNDNGAVTLTVLTTDNGNTGTPGAQQDSDAITLNIAAVNDLPYANDDAYSTNEDTAITFDVRTNDGDVDGPPLNVTEINGTAISIGSPVNLADGSISIDAGGLLTFTPNSNFNGSVSFSYQLSDIQGGTANANVTIDVLAINDSPVAGNDTASTNEDTAVAVDVLNNDADPEGDTLTITQIEGVAATINVPVPVTNGSVTLQASGDLLFTPATNFNGTATFSYQVDDGNGGTDTATVSVNVAPQNDLPTAGDDNYSTSEDTPITFDVRDNDTDVDGQPLSVIEINGTPISVGSPVSIAEGTIGIDVAGLLTFTPNLNYNGTVNFNYTISDGAGGTDTAAVQIIVSAVDDAPVATNDSASTNEDTGVSIDVLSNDSDAESATLNVTRVDGTNVIVGSPVGVANGQVTLQGDGTLTFEPNPNYNGITTFDYTISDGTGNTDTATVTVDVQPVNDIPVANPDSVNTDEDIAVTLDVTANDTDVDGDTLTVVTIDSSAAVTGIPVIVNNGSVTLQADGTLQFVPTPHYNGTTTFDYTIQDAGGATATTTATIVVAPINDAPYAGNDTVSTQEDTPVSFDVRSNDGDVDGNPLTVNQINGQPISLGNPVSVANGQVSVDAAGILTFSPNPDYNGSTSFDYQVADGNGGTATATVNLTVTAQNDAPVAVDDSAVTDEETLVNIDLVANDTDVDSSPLSVTEINGTPIAIGSPVTVANGIVSLLADGTVDFAPDVDFAGVANFTYRVDDGDGANDLALVQVTVNNVNDAPIATNDSSTTPEDTPVTIDVIGNDTDTEGDSLVVSAINSQPISVGNPVVTPNGTVSLQPDGQLRFSPAPDFNGPAVFTYTVEDGNGGSDSAQVSINVTAVNDLPVAVNDSDSTNEDTPVSLNVIANDTDADGDSLSVSEVNGQAISVGTPITVTDGTVSLQLNGELLFTPAPNFSGNTNFDYRITDGTGLSNTATVSLTIASVNDTPVANDDSDTLAEDTPITLDLIANDADIDADPLAVTHVDGTPITTTSPVAVANGIVSLQADGTVVFTPTLNFNGNTDFTYTVADPGGLSDDALVSLIVSPVNDAPFAADDSVSTAEDTPISFDVRSNDGDVDADPLTVSQINGSAISVSNPVSVPNGSVSIDAAGVLTFTPDTDYVGPASFGYTIIDGNGLSASATVNVVVTAVNDDPVAGNDSAVTSEDTTVNMNVLANDTDTDGIALAVVEINGTPISAGNSVGIVNGSVTLLPDGTIDVTPGANYTGSLIFDYTVSDGAGGTDVGLVDVTVTPVNDAPVAVNDSGSMAEDTAVTLNVLGNDADVDGDALTVSEVNGQPIALGTPVLVGNGSVELQADGQLLFTPTPDYNGNASFDYTVSDNNGGTDTATVNLTISPANDAPAANDDSDVLAEDSPISLDLVANDTDIDGDTLSVTQINGTAISTTTPVAVSNGIVSLQPDGTVVFSPVQDYHGPANFSYTVADPSGETDTANVSLTVTPVNDAPNAVNDTATTPEDTAVSIDVRANDSDVDGDSLTVTLVNGTAISIGNPVSIPNGSVSIDAAGDLIFTPASDYVGPATFDYTISDGNGQSANATASITVTALNDAPVAVNDSASTAEDTTVNMSLTSNDTDVDGDLLTVSHIDSTLVNAGDTVAIANGSVTLLANGTVDVTPNADFNGNLTFDYTVSDGAGASDTASVTVNVTPVNDAPVAVDDSISTPEDTAVSIDVRSNDTDTDGDALTVTAINGTAISVGNPVTTLQGQVSIDASGVLSFTPNPNYNGPAVFDYTLSDAAGATDIGTVTVTVTQVNDAPVSTDDTATTQEDTPVGIDVTANDSDPDLDTLSVNAVNGQPIAVGSPVTVANGAVDLMADGTLEFSPATNFTGSTSFAYTVTDPSGATSSSFVTVSVTAQNDAPVALDDTGTTAEDTPFTIDVTGNDTDVDADPLTVSEIDGQAISIGNPVTTANGTVALQADGQLVFTPAADYNGTTTFDYTVIDGNGASDTAQVTVTVTPVADSPIANDDSGSTNEDNAVTLNVLGNDTDADGDALVVSAINGQPISTGSVVAVANGAVELLPSGDLSFNPTANYNGNASFDYTVSDNNGGSDTATVDLTISPVNDAPLASDDSDTLAEDTSVTLSLTANDTDIDSDPLTVTLINSTPVFVGTPLPVINGSVELQPDGTVLFTPSPNYHGAASFIYTVADPSGATDTANVNLTVTPTNDAPVATNDVTSTAEDSPVTLDVRSNDTDIDGDALSVTLIDGAPIAPGSPVGVANGSVSIDAGGVLTFTPASNFTGLTSFAYTVSDGNGQSANASVDVTVTAVNDAPVAVNDSSTTTEDTPVNIDLAGNDTDVDADPLTVTEIDGTAISVGTPVTIANGSVSLLADGTVDITPDSNFNGTLLFNYTISDGAGGTDTASVSVNVTPVNDAPGAIDDVIGTSEDLAVIIDALGNDSDPESDPLAITEINGQPISVGNPVTTPDGSVALQADGQLSFSPNPNTNGAVSFSYTVTDGNGGTDTALVTVNIAAVNDAPVAIDDATTTPEDTPVSIDLVANDTDVDGDALSTVQINGTPVFVGNPVSVANGVVGIDSGGVVTFTPDSNFTGNATFDYTVIDTSGSSDTGSVTVTVTPVNDAPFSIDDGVSTPEDTPVNIDVTANDGDPDGDPITISTVDGNAIATGTPVSVANGSVELLADGTLEFTPSNNFTGVTNFSYSISDPVGATSSSVVTVSVAVQNDPPVALDDTGSTQEDSVLTIDVVGNDTDVEGDPLSVSAVDGQPISIGNPVSTANGQVALLPDGQLTFTPDANYNGPAVFSYTVIDGNGGSDTAQVAITVNAVDDAPIAVNDVTSTAEETPVSIDVLANDSDSDGDPLTVTQVNGAPISVGNPVTVANGQVAVEVTGLLTFTPAPNYAGPASFTYTVSDPAGNTSTGSVSVTVSPVNDAPVATDDSTTTNEDTPILIDALANDADQESDPLTVVEIGGLPITTGQTVAVTNGSVTLQADGQLLFSPAADFSGIANFDYTVSDPSGATDSATITVTVSPTNDAPVAVDDAGTTAEDTAINLNLTSNDTDIDGDAATITEIDGIAIAVGSPVTVSNGVVALQPDGSVTFTPALNYHGPANFSYTVADPSGATDTADVNLIITPVNDNPVAADDVTSTPEDTAVSLDVRSNDGDVDGQPLTVTQVNGNPITSTTPVAVSNGIVSIDVAGILTFTPSPDFNGPANFNYTISDGAGGSATATASVNVIPADDAPIAVDDSASTLEDTAVVVDLTANDIDIDSPTLSVVSVGGTPITTGTPVVLPEGLVSLLPDGTTRFTPNNNFNGVASFAYTVSDGAGNTDTANAVITVIPANDAPIASDDVGSTAEDTPINLAVVANDTDPDGDTISIAEVEGQAISVGSPVAVSDGIVALQADGTLTFTPANNFNGIASFGYTVSDPTGATSTAVVNVLVGVSNDAPVANDDTDVTTEDTAVTLNVAGNDTDSDGDTLSVSEIDGQALVIGSPVPVTNGLVSLRPDGQISLLPSNNYNGAITFSYTVTDGNGGTDTANVSVDVLPINDAPVALLDTDVFTEDTAVTLDVTANDFDADGDALAVSTINGTPISVGSPVAVVNGVVSLEPDGSLTFTPAPDYNGPANFDYQIDDSNGGVATGTVNLTVNPTNDAPVAIDDSVTTPEDTIALIDVRTNDNDVDGDALIVSAINGTPIAVGSPVAVANGTVSVNLSGALMFTPDSNYTGTTSFGYTITDGNGESASATVQVQVDPVNDSPVAVNDTGSTNEDTPVNLDLLTNDSDPDSATLTIAAIDGVPISTNGSVAVANGLVTLLPDGTIDFAPNANYNGPITFGYTVADDTGNIATATVDIDVLPVNDAPVAVNDGYTTPADTPVNFDVRVNDSDVDVENLSAVAINGTSLVEGVPVPVANGSVTLLANGTLTFDPQGGFSGTATFDYTVADTSGATATATVNVLVDVPNADPVANPDIETGVEDNTTLVDVLANDTDADGDILAVGAVDGQPLTVGAPVSVADGTVTLQAGGQLLFTPNADYTGITTFAYTVIDGNGGTATSTATIDVTPQNDAPVAIDDATTTSEDTPVTIAVRSNDSDIDGDSFTVTAVDGTAISVGNPVTVTNGIVSLNASGDLIFSPDTNYSGAASFTYTIDDGNAGQASATVLVNVTPVNDSPVANNDTGITDEDTSLAINLIGNDADPEGAAIIVTEIDGIAAVVNTPITITNGTVTLQPDQSVLFTPDANYNGPASFNYTIADPQGASDTGLVNLTVNPVNDQPAALNDSTLTSEETPVTVDVLANDADADADLMSVTAVNGSAVSVGIPTPVTDGTVTLQADGTLLFTPATNYTGVASFNYTVSDPGGLTDTASVNVAVTALNDNPVAANDTAVTNEDISVLVDVLSNDSDADGDALSVSEINGQPASVGAAITIPNGTATLQAGGQVLFTPAPNFNGATTFDYIVTDGNGGFDTATVDLNVVPVDDAPLAATDSVTGSEDTPVLINVLANDQEVDGQSIAVNAVNGQPVTVGAPLSVADGTVTLQTDGQILFTPTANFNGITSFDYTIVDTSGLTSTATANIDLAALNDPPVATDDSNNTAEDASITLDLVGNDVDVDGDPLVITQINGNPINVGDTVNVANGWVTLLSDGVVDFTPTPDYNGPASFAYTVGDGSGLTDSATVNLNITPVPDAPLATDDSYATPEDTAVNIDPLVNDIDADGNALSITQVDGTPISIGSPVTVPGGTVTLRADGTLDFNPSTNFDGTSSFAYTVSDGTGLNTTANITIAVTAQNDPPVATDDTEVTAEDTPVNIDVLGNDSDPDNPVLAVTSIDGIPVIPGAPIPVANGTVTVLANGTVDYVPATNYNGTTSFTYEVADPFGAIDTGLVTIDVTAQNDPPVATNDTAVTTEETPVNLDPRINDTDVEGSALTITAIEGSPIVPGNSVTVTGGSVTMLPDGTISFAPAPDFFGPAQFTYTVRDDNGASATAVVDITVNGTDDPPTAINDALTGEEDGPLLLDLTGNDTDPDGDPLQIIQIDGQPIAPLGSVTVTGGTVVMDPDGSVRFLPDPDLNGPVSFTYTISDPSGLTSAATADLTINPVNDIPTPVDDVINLIEDGSATVTLTGNDNDPDGEPLTLSHINGTPVSPGDVINVNNGTVTVGINGQVTFDPNPDFFGPTDFSYSVTDPSGASQSAQVTVNVTPVNDPPVAEPDNVTGPVGQPMIFDPVSNDADPDADPLQITHVAGQPIAPGQTITIPEGSITLLPNGTLRVDPVDSTVRRIDLNYQVADPSGETSTAIASINFEDPGYPLEEDRDDDASRDEYRPSSFEFPIVRAGIYDPVFISPAVRVSQHATQTSDLNSVFNIDSASNDVFQWNHSTNRPENYRLPYLNFAYVRSDDPLGRELSDLICGRFDRNQNLECWPQIRPESVANMQFVLLNERVTPDTNKPDQNWPPAKARPEVVKRSAISDLQPFGHLFKESESASSADYLDFSAQIDAIANKPLSLQPEADEQDELSEAELENK